MIRMTGSQMTGVWSALARVALAAAVLCLASLPAQASAPQAWVVESQSGRVQLVKAGISPIALTPGDVFVVGDWIETGPDGRALLRRGEETIVVAPNSKIGLPTDPGASNAGSITTRILQTMGTILLTVEKKAKQHFAVETPYLIAVVKGTTFTVSVEGGRSNVHVVEGLVEVMNQASGRSVLVHPGQIGSVLRNGPGDVELEGAAEPQGTPDSGSTTRADNGAGNGQVNDGAAQPAATPASAHASANAERANAGKANMGQNRGQAAKVRIAETLGNQPLDLTNSTKGLVRAASVAAPQANLGKGATRDTAKGAAPLTGSGVQSTVLGNSNGLAVGKGVSASPGLVSSGGLAVSQGVSANAGLASSGGLAIVQDLSANTGLGGGSGLVTNNGLNVNAELGAGNGLVAVNGLNVNAGLGAGNGLGVGQGQNGNPRNGSQK
jgi:hypothetical protein